MNTVELKLVGELMDKWERIATALEKLVVLMTRPEPEDEYELNDEDII